MRDTRVQERRHGEVERPQVAEGGRHGEQRAPARRGGPIHKGPGHGVPQPRSAASAAAAAAAAAVAAAAPGRDGAAVGGAPVGLLVSLALVKVAPEAAEGGGVVELAVHVRDALQEALSQRLRVPNVVYGPPDELPEGVGRVGIPCVGDNRHVRGQVPLSLEREQRWKPGTTVVDHGKIEGEQAVSRARFASEKPCLYKHLGLKCISELASARFPPYVFFMAKFPSAPNMMME